MALSAIWALSRSILIIGVWDQFRLGGGGGRGLVARILYPLLARKSSGFARMIFFFLPENGYLKNSMGEPPSPRLVGIWFWYKTGLKNKQTNNTGRIGGGGGVYCAPLDPPLNTCNFLREWLGPKAKWPAHVFFFLCSFSHFQVKWRNIIIYIGWFYSTWNV